LFNKFIEKSTLDFSNKLKFQRVQTLEKLKAQKEEEAKKERLLHLETIGEAQGIYENVSSHDGKSMHIPTSQTEIARS